MSVSRHEARERAWVEVDLDALVQNSRAIAQATGTRLLPMVKADGYGVGAVAVARRLEALDPWGYGVATVEEGAALRAAGIRRPVVVFTPALATQLDPYDVHDLRPVLEDRAAILAWRARGERPFHLEIDTGMRRSGVNWQSVAGLREVLDTAALEGAFTHFHSADIEESAVATEEQFRRFLAAAERLPRRPGLLHVANSAAALRDRRYALDLVRPGIFLYGGLAGDGLPAPRPVVAVRARVVAVRRLGAGDSVSYGARWTTARETSVATLGIGYADGVPRALTNRGEVLLGGKRRPIVGTVTMDMLMLDVGDDSVSPGDVATVIGADGSDCVTLADVARLAGTVSYEVLTRLGPRLPRAYR